MLLTIAVIAVALGGWVNRAHQQRRVVKLVESAGGQARYGYQRFGKFAEEMHAPGPAWLRRLIGVEYFDDIAEIYLDGAMLDDELFDAIGKVRSLQFLSLAGANVTDDRLKRLSGLRNLEMLDLSETAVSDVGLAGLAPLRRLRDLRLFHCDVSAPGLAHLTALPIRRLCLSPPGPSGPQTDVLNQFGELKQIIFSNELSRSTATFDHVEAVVDFEKTSIEATSVPALYPRRGAIHIVAPSAMAAIGEIAADTPCDDVWARAVMLDYTSWHPDCRQRSTELFLTAIERSSRPAPIWISCGLSEPLEPAASAARRVVEAGLAGHPQAKLLQRLVAEDRSNMICFAAALALEPDNRDAWFAIALRVSGNLRRAVLDAWAAADSDNAAPHYLRAVAATFEFDEPTFVESIRRATNRPKFLVPLVPWPAARDLPEVRAKYDPVMVGLRSRDAKTALAQFSREFGFRDWKNRALASQLRGGRWRGSLRHQPDGWDLREKRTERLILPATEYVRTIHKAARRLLQEGAARREPEARFWLELCAELAYVASDVHEITQVQANSQWSLTLMTDGKVSQASFSAKFEEYCQNSIGRSPVGILEFKGEFARESAEEVSKQMASLIVELLDVIDPNQPADPNR